MNRGFLRIQKFGYTARPWVLLFSPGVVLCLVGLAALIAPRFFLGLIAGLFLFLGVLFCIAAWKLLSFKRNMDSFLKTRVYIQRSPITFETFSNRESSEEGSSRKIVFH